MTENQWARLPEALEDAVYEHFCKGRPVYASWKAADGKEYFHECDGMNVAQFEQATEFEARKMKKALARFIQTGSPRTAKTFAEAYCRVHYYRSRYSELMGVPFDDSDLHVREVS